ncbi:hypothetical protein [Aeromicrobium sp. Sec7.5]|uniref:hypothetical protein n=1 Tax=Aeromicrobium sp. Sec7.5 TaxID=3121276 RepID=UPI002FE486C1
MEIAHRMLIAVLWVGAELVAERARDHGYDLEFDRNPDSEPERASVRDVFQRMKAIETLAMTGVFRPDVPLGSPSADLGAALGRWDVIAHRALLAHGSTVVLHHVASLEVATFDAFRAATTRAHVLGVIDSLTAERIDPAIAGAASAWRDVENIASQFSFGHSSPDRDIMGAGEEVRSRFSGIASLTCRAEDVDVLGTFTSHLATSMGLAAAARDLVDERELLAPARAINRLLREQNPRPDHLGSIVSAADLHQGRVIPLPAEARQAVRGPLDLAFAASAEAVRRSAAFDPIYRSSLTPTSEPGRTLSRSPEVAPTQRSVARAPSP